MNPRYRYIIPRTIHVLILLLLSISDGDVLAQANITYTLSKPKDFENRKLASELTPDRKIGPVKRLKENIVSHYNFYFNANIKINNTVASAKRAHRDDFTKLLSFYNYSLDNTSNNKQELDSVILKTNNGILLHDLRNDWVDDMYLLMGQAYFYQKKFDSAYDVFQYINYTFQPKTKDEIGFEKTIGSNINTDGNVYTISSKEKKLSPHTLARNDALIWLIRTFIEQGEWDDARSLIGTLSRDIQFPDRLQDQLTELKAYWFYQQNQYDSSAFYLEKSIGAAVNNPEKSRRYFLIAQLYSKVNQNAKANDAYEKAVSLTTDPVLEAYARIYQTGLSSNETDLNKRTEDNIKALLQMAEREKYAQYRNLIYAAAGELEAGRKESKQAIHYFIKSNQYNTNDPVTKGNNNLKIAELAFDIQQYDLAKNYYDSVNIGGLENAEAITTKKNVCNDLFNNLKTIRIEDSLQQIASMPDKERQIYLRDLLKKLKREQGIEETTSSNRGNTSSRNTLLEDNSTSLFSNDAKKGEWYFNNPTLIAQGAIAFKNKWGSRPNVDNWRRSTTLGSLNKALEKDLKSTATAGDELASTELTEEGLIQNLPLTPERKTASDEKRHAAMRNLATLYKEKLDDCGVSISWNEKVLSEKPDYPELEKILFELSVCYNQKGNNSKGSFYQDQLNQRFPGSEFNKLLKDPLAAGKAKDELQRQATMEYDKVYDLFLSGKFDQAMDEKKKADEKFGPNRWSPQLLYIESVYYIRNLQDSLAVATLNKIPALYPQSPLAERAGNLALVVMRREEIENELKNLQVQRSKEDSISWIDDSPLPKGKESSVKREAEAPKVVDKSIVAKVKVDSSAFKVPVIEEKALGYQFNPTEPYGVLMLLKDVDVVYINEAKRALSRYNSQRYSSTPLNIRNDLIGNLPYILISVFPNAADALTYVEKAAAVAPREIFPWLPAEKYSFVIVSPDNLKRMIEEKGTEKYMQFIRSQLPGKF